MVLTALKKSGVDAHAFDPRDHGLEALKAQRFDRAFIALHGRFGEDGTVQGALEYLGIPYTGSGVMASALAMDKWRTKLLWRAAGLPTPDYELMSARTDPAGLAARLGLPLMVKPAREGSSIGMSKVTAIEKIAPAYELAARYDDVVIAERFVEGMRAHRGHPRGRAAAADPARDSARVLRLRGQVLRRRHPLYLPVRTARRAGAVGAADGAGSVSPPRLQRLGARRRDARPRRQIAVAGGQHDTGHDRPQPGADGRSRTGNFIRRSMRADTGVGTCRVTSNLKPGTWYRRSYVG